MNVLCLHSLEVEEVTARPEASEPSSVSKQIKDKESRGKSWNKREPAESIQVSVCEFVRASVLSLEVLDFLGA